ncbi:MAG: hypothetical protein J3K34DRAFT_424303 [Monoraphidium minutum]|nr:MAG: hypothetical protein J3K34DRAFT_424303 [Monoraphidium minutum]
MRAVHPNRAVLQRSACTPCSVYAAAPSRGRLSGFKARARKSDDALDALDALGIGDGASSSGQEPADDRVVWWQARPQQSAPPRQGLSTKGDGRFINESVIGFAGSTRTGRGTAVGSDLDVPQVEPFCAYLLIAAQLSVYAAGTWVGATQGVDASAAMGLELALQPSAVLAAGPDSEWWRMGSCLLLHNGMPHLALDTFALAYLGPDAEALVGHAPFLAIYLLAGLTAAATSLLLGPDVATAGATGALLGLIGAMVGYEAANKELRTHGELGRGQRRQLGSPWAAVALGGAALLLGLLPTGGPIAIDDAAQLAGGLAGVWLGSSVGPRFTVTREVDIPEGSMMVPQDAREVVVVVDMRSGAKKAAAAAGYAAALVAATAAVGLLRTHLG